MIIRLLDDYLPKSGVYDKLPWGKLIFDHEQPPSIYQWLRCLSPIRFYLYGNEMTIPNNWSKIMISNETSRSKEKFIGDDWFTFVENEIIKDDVKWEFFPKHAHLWSIKHFRPIPIASLSEHIQFQCALERAHATYEIRRSTVSAQIHQWYAACMASGLIEDEVNLSPIERNARTAEILTLE